MCQGVTGVCKIRHGGVGYMNRHGGVGYMKRQSVCLHLKVLFVPCSVVIWEAHKCGLFGRAFTFSTIQHSNPHCSHAWLSTDQLT